MAITKTATASADCITLNKVTSNDTSGGFTFGNANSGVESEVVDGRLVPPYHMTHPGVFTTGTTPEGTASNPQNDSNS